jgi:RNA polymerase sigma factor (TIGR02999 family)
MEINGLLKDAAAGDLQATDRLFESVYRELYRLAGSHRRRWQGDETLNTTMLVHEAYIKLVHAEDPQWSDHGHFFAVASRAMRHVLVDYSRRKMAAKRGLGASRADIEVDSLPDIDLPEDLSIELLALEQALAQLEAVNPRQGQVVECRFFAGLSIEDTCKALGVSESTVRRDWEFAKIHLQQLLENTPVQ